MKINILVVNIHGLLRAKNLELGRDADTGGQTKYVYEYAKEMGNNPKVNNVYVVTKLVEDKRYSSDYSIKEESISKKVKIIRVKGGGKRYIKKEKLWTVLDEIVENVLGVILEKGLEVDLIHSHYADAGYVASELSKFLGIPFIHTGHSLGMPKKLRLLENGMSQEEIDDVYNIEQRIREEEKIIKEAAMIITSTQQEIDGQYSCYKSFKNGSYEVIPPGIDTIKFFPYYFLNDRSFFEREEYQESMSVRHHIRNELKRFFLNPDKPLILTICRPEKRKNIEGLIEAYGNDRELQAIANLAIYAGIRKDISKKTSQESKVLMDMLLAMDKYDLYGKMAIPKKHDFEYEIPELYRYVAELGGVFVNSAYIEPFGITLLEAGSVGLPIVSTDNGGPRDIVENCKNGVLVDVKNTEVIAKSIKGMLIDKTKWHLYSNNGVKKVREYYSWESHCQQLLSCIEKRKIVEMAEQKDKSIKSKLKKYQKLIITDIDNTLLGDDSSLHEFLEWYKKNQEEFGFGIATGRNIQSALEVLKEFKVPDPQILITSVGTEIYYYNNGALALDKRWNSLLSENWQADKIRDLMKKMDFLELQEDQRDLKISYHIKSFSYSNLKKVHQKLKSHKLRYKLIPVEGKFLDIIPFRASKYKAIMYICNKWRVNVENVLVAGDSGNDKDMLTKMPKGVVVANFQEELGSVKNVYFSNKNNAGAILDGLKHYKFI